MKFNKKGLELAWDKTALIILLAFTLFVIVMIFIFISNKIKNIFF